MNDWLPRFLLLLPGCRQRSDRLPPPQSAQSLESPRPPLLITPLRLSRGTGEELSGPDAQAPATEAEKPALEKLQGNEEHDLYLVKVIYVQAEGLRRWWWDGLKPSRTREAAIERHHLG